MMNVPTDWDVVKIGEMYDITKKPKEIIYSNYGYLPFIAMDLIPIGSTYSGNFKLKKSTEISSGTYVEEGDLLLAKITPCFENGKQCIITGLPNGFGIASTEIIPIKEKTGTSSKYFLFYYLLQSDIRTLIAGKMEGATGRQRVPVHLIKELLIPFPSLNEQQKIAAILFTIQQAIEIQDSIIEKMRELKKSTLHYIFTHGLRGEMLKETEMGRIPESWNVVPIGKVYNFTKKPKEIIFSNYDHLPFIAMDLIPVDLPNSGKFKFKKSTEISSGTYVEDGDFLLAKITPCFENGKQCIVTGLPGGFGIASTEVIPIKEKPGISDKYFLYYYLLTDDVRKLIAGKMEGATGRQRVPVNLLQEFMIPFPLLTEQREMTKLFLTIDQKIELHAAKKSTLQDLFKTMLNKLMTGEVRVKDLDIDISEVSE